MNYTNFSFSGDYLILAEKTISFPTPSGKSWSIKNTKVERFIFTAQQYENYVTSIPFFNNFGYGASCRARCSYTRAGYLPTEISTISPFRKEKHVVSFHFINLSYAREKGGYRENEILKNATSWEHFPTDESACYTLITENNNSATYQPAFDRWVN